MTTEDDKKPGKESWKFTMLWFGFFYLLFAGVFAAIAILF